MSDPRIDRSDPIQAAAEDAYLSRGDDDLTTITVVDGEVDGYRRDEIQRVLDGGPADDEGWFRIVITGGLQSRHLNITPAEAAAIRDLLERGAT